MMRRLLHHYLSGTMNTTAPKQGTPAADQYLFKIPLHVVPLRGPDVGVLRMGTIFMVWV